MVVLAADSDPLEILMGLPSICEENVKYIFKEHKLLFRKEFKRSWSSLWNLKVKYFLKTYNCGFNYYKRKFFIIKLNSRIKR